MNIRELNPDTKFPSGDGRPVAVLRFAPDALAQQYGIEFVRGADDFDYYQTAVIAPSDGPITRLLRYDHDPDPGTAVYADSRLDVEQAQRAVFHLLKLAREDFTWLAERTVQSRPTTQADPDAISEDVRVPLRPQEARVTGEVSIRKETVTDTQRVTDAIRREEVHVEVATNARIHVEGNLTGDQRARFEAMNENDRVRYERFTDAERGEYDALTPERQSAYAADYDRRNPLQRVAEVNMSRDDPRR